MWHIDDGWKHKVIHQICLWGDKFEILQHIRYLQQKEILCLAMPYVCWGQQTVPNSTKITVLIAILLVAHLSLWLVPQ